MCRKMIYNISGIKNVTEDILNFKYDKHYKKIGLMLKNAKTEKERKQIKQKRNKEKVAIERICDMIGENEVQNLKAKFDYILQKYNIEKEQFVKDMYNIKLMKYTGPLMKTLEDTEMTIKIYYELCGR